jgi:hypothetical protein
MPIDNTHRSFRSNNEPDQLPFSKAAHCAVRATIGQELKACYEVPRDLPHEMTAILMRLNRVERPT